MKKIRYITVALLMAVTFSGCSLLDIRPDGRLTLDEIFADHHNTAAYLNSCYGNIPGKGFSYYWVCNALTAMSDEGYLVYSTAINDPIPAKMYEGAASASSHPIRDYNTNNPSDNYYAVYMWQLRQCTIFLQYIDNAKVNTEAERNRWRAEAHVLRAYYMSELLKWFGAFAYEPEGYTDDYNYANLKQRTVWELAEQIDIECTAAIAANELPWRIESANERLRVTKALAWCIKSKSYLFAASPVHAEEFSDAEQAAHWKKAFEVNQQALDALEANGYALKTSVSNSTLYTGPAAAYQELFTSTSLTTSNDPETIWQATDYMNALAHNYIGSKEKLLNAGRAGVIPTQEIVDAYEVTDAGRTKAAPLLDLSDPYDLDTSDPNNIKKTANYSQAALDLGYNPDDPYLVNRDPRMAVCIIKNGDPIYWNGETKTVETFEGGDNGITSDPSESKFTRTGYYYRKYVAPEADAVNGISSAPWKYFRLGEIKLNLAEAAAEAAAQGVAGARDVAFAQVNAIRNRVGMPDLPTDLTDEELILRVRQERMVELVYEECRYFDVRRWAESYRSSVLFQEFNMRCNKLTSMWITKDPLSGDLTYERKVLLSNNSTNPRDLLLPIPEKEAQNLYSYTNKRWQNAGW